MTSTKIVVELTIAADGRIWANSTYDGRCVLRIQGVDERKIENFHTNKTFIDLRIRDNEHIHLIVENEEENGKAHKFFTEHILYQGHSVKIMTRQLTRTITCDCGAKYSVKMKVADL